ncbi:MAG: hypothetical protein KDD43_11820, partial [Bdellovibrionales bacterium]|nr:hypothetical protein [Bdellovibrionales bacterium]
NTRGMEDSPEVSPDGRFVIVGSYSPVDFGYCAVNGHDYQHPACNSNFYDFSGTERPGLFGANRILSSSEIDHRIPSLNYDPKTALIPIATPPVASFGFRLQPDGSYAQPFVIGIDADGYSWQQTYGFTFDWTFGDFASIFFSWNELGEQPETNNDIYGALVRLGQEVKIGEYQDAQLINFKAVKANIDPIPVCGQLDCEFGNPNITPTRIWFDNERQSDDLFFADRIGADFGPPKRVPLSVVGRGESMPHFKGNTLYYMCDTGLCAADLTEGADPALLESWSEERQIMAPLTLLPWTINAGRAGRVVAVSEPSLATIREGQVDKLYLYFGYITQTQYGTGERDFGADWAVGRVPIR